MPLFFMFKIYRIMEEYYIETYITEWKDKDNVIISVRKDEGDTSEQVGVVGDIIDSGVVPVVRLTEIYRQQDGSYIIQSAHDIIHGRVPDLRNRSSDFFFLPVADDDEAQQTVIDLAARRLPTAYPGKEVQVLCPMRKDGYKVGCNVLNPLLQQALNPDGWPMEISDYRLRRFDRVMQMKNNYRLGVYNGDVGEVMGMEHSVNDVGQRRAPEGERRAGVASALPRPSGHRRLRR